MKFFLDENFPRKATQMLESQGFEVFDIRGTEIEGADDKTLLRNTTIYLRFTCQTSRVSKLKNGCGPTISHPVGAF